MLEFSFLPKNPKKELTKLPYQNPSKKLIKQYSLFVFFVFFWFISFSSVFICEEDFTGRCCCLLPLPLLHTSSLFVTWFYHPYDRINVFLKLVKFSMPFEAAIHPSSSSSNRKIEWMRYSCRMKFQREKKATATAEEKEHIIYRIVLWEHTQQMSFVLILYIREPLTLSHTHTHTLLWVCAHVFSTIFFFLSLSRRFRCVNPILILMEKFYLLLNLFGFSLSHFFPSFLSMILFQTYNTANKQAECIMCTVCTPIHMPFGYIHTNAHTPIAAYHHMPSVIYIRVLGFNIECTTNKVYTCVCMCIGGALKFGFNVGTLYNLAIQSSVQLSFVWRECSAYLWALYTNPFGHIHHIIEYNTKKKLFFVEFVSTTTTA